MQGARVSHRLLRSAQVGLGDDLEQGRPSAIQVDPSHAVEILMQGLARVLLEVRPRQAHGLLAIGQEDLQRTARDDRDLVLADLVALGQVRVEVILAREHRAPVDVRADREPEADRVRHRRSVYHRQHPRQGDVHRRSLRVGRRAERGRRAREHLAAGQQLRVGLDAHDDLPGHRRYLGCGRSSWQAPPRSTSKGSR